jgi:outer membrane protein assembly factor BamB
VTQFGEGPNATPLIAGDLLVSLGYSGDLHALDRASGEPRWSHNLIDDFGGKVLEFGYSASPILHDGRVLVLAGGESQGLLAFEPSDGSVAWSGVPSSVSYSTPTVIEVGGHEQIVYFTADEVVGIAPGSGEKLWGWPVVNQYLNNASDVRWNGEDLLWVPSQLDGGTRVLRLTADGDATTVEQVWESGKMSIHHWNALRRDGTLYASIGSNASIMAAIDMASGEFLWRERGFTKVSFVDAGERAILLDEDGLLALAELGPEQIRVVSQVELDTGTAWTPPTLAGTTLFVRDKRRVRALDVSDR